jgi:hypothetical protein
MYWIFPSMHIMYYTPYVFYKIIICKKIVLVYITKVVLIIFINIITYE